MYCSYVKNQNSISKMKRFRRNKDMPPSKIICQLCSEVYKKPKLLSCFHSFCETCLYDYVGKHAKNEQFSCPSCATKILVPINIATDFKTNNFVQAYIEQNTNQDGDEFEYCDICGIQGEVGYFCEECEQKICQNCNTVHSSMKATKQHRVSEIKGAARILNIQRFCPEHDEDLRFYCRTCQEGVCVNCKLEEHQVHVTEHVKEAKVKGRQTIKGFAKEIDSHLRDLKCEQEALAYRKRLVDKSFQETCLSIQKQAEGICRLVSVVRDKKLLEAEKLRDEQQKAIDEVESEITIWENQIATVSDYVHFVNRSTSEVDVLETCDKVKEKVKSIEKFECPSLDVRCIELDTVQPTKSEVENLFGNIFQYPALRLRLKYGSTNSFECDSRKEFVDAICPTGSDTAWIARHVDKENSSLLTLFQTNGDTLQTIVCEKTVKCLALLEGDLHVLTKDSFTKLNTEKTDLVEIVSPLLPLLLASNTTSMFYLSPDHTCHYVTNTDVKPLDETFLCFLPDLQNPTKMAVDDNQNIVILDADLKLVRIFDFNGVPKNQSSFEYPNFHPIDVCIDRWSDILVVDDGNEAIHELSADGQGREIMYSKFSGLKRVCCVAGNEDSLWFGSMDGTIVVKHL